MNSRYQKSKNLYLNATNNYPYYPTENIEGNPYLDNKTTNLNNTTTKNVKFAENYKIPTKNWGYLDHNELIENYSSPAQEKLNLNYETKNYTNTANPEVWGPAFWFSLHNGSLRYPIEPSPSWKERMKQFIMGIPVMVPCEKCADHATAYLEHNSKNMDDIVSSRSKLFEFFWQFHNFVNIRLNKPKLSLEDAYKLYKGNVAVTKLKY